MFISDLNLERAPQSKSVEKTMYNKSAAKHGGWDECSKTSLTCTAGKMSPLNAVARARKVSIHRDPYENARVCTHVIVLDFNECKKLCPASC